MEFRRIAPRKGLMAITAVVGIAYVGAAMALAIEHGTWLALFVATPMLLLGFLLNPWRRPNL